MRDSLHFGTAPGGAFSTRTPAVAKGPRPPPQLSRPHPRPPTVVDQPIELPGLLEMNVDTQLARPRLAPRIKAAGPEYDARAGTLELAEHTDRFQESEPTPILHLVVRDHQ